MRTEAAVALLRRTRLFAELREDTLRALADRSVERSYPRLFYQGDPGSGLYVLASGLVKVVVTSEDGEEMVLVTLGPGDAFGELSIVDGGPRSAVLVHANAANTMLTSAWIRPVPVAETLAWIFCLAALVGVGAAVLPLWLVPLPAVLAAWGYLGVAGLRVDGGRLMDVVRPVGAVLAAMLATVLLRGAAELRQRRRVQSLFGEYVPAGVVAQLLEQDRVAAATGGERLEVAVLFCDLRGFTTMAEALEPGQVRDVLNAYYRATTRIVFDHGGTVMQYVGDEVFAVFGAPIAQPEAAATALRCATAMQRAAADLNDQLGGRGLPPVAYGIGLHRGEVVAAHVGNEIRRQYAVVGDPVNVGSRLCGQAGAGEVVVSDAILDRAGDPLAVEPLGDLPLKGKRQPVRAFRVATGQSSPAAT